MSRHGARGVRGQALVVDLNTIGQVVGTDHELRRHYGACWVGGCIWVAVSHDVWSVERTNRVRIILRMMQDRLAR